MEFFIFLFGMVYFLIRISKEKIADADYKKQEQIMKDRSDRWMSEMKNDAIENQVRNYIARMRHEDNSKLDAEIEPFIKAAVLGKTAEELRSASSWYQTRQRNATKPWNIYNKENIVYSEKQNDENVLRILLAKKGLFESIDALHTTEYGTGMYFPNPINRYIFEQCVKEVSRVRGMRMELRRQPCKQEYWYIYY